LSAFDLDVSSDFVIIFKGYSESVYGRHIL
jgi:hypothetical protein